MNTNHTTENQKYAVLFPQDENWPFHPGDEIACDSHHRPYETVGVHIENGCMIFPVEVSYGEENGVTVLVSMVLLDPIDEIFNRKEQVFMKSGVPHRDDDYPAVIDENGTQYWFVDGLCHREGDKPAIIESRGAFHWFVRGKCGREGDKPAYVCLSPKESMWFKDDKCHRDGGKPAMITEELVAYWKDGALDRDGDLPAVIFIKGPREYWRKGERYYPVSAEGLPSVGDYSCSVADDGSLQVVTSRGNIWRVNDVGCSNIRG
jgi:hypothetical protein